MYNLTIVHIEDEFEEFESLVSSVAFWLEGYWEEKLGLTDQPIMATTKRIANCDRPQSSWVVYEITTDSGKDHTVRYIFNRDSKISKKIEGFFFDDKVFVLDVLRPVSGKTKLGVSVFESLKSINRYLKRAEDAVLFTNAVMFTAHQGSDLDGIEGGIPKKISKANESQLEDFFADALMRSLEDG